MVSHSKKQAPFWRIRFTLISMIPGIPSTSTAILLGRSDQGRILIVSYTERDDAIRLISSREVTRSELKDYEEH